MPWPIPALAPLPAGAVLLALDVSSTAIGWSVFQSGIFAAAGLVKNPASWPSPRRIRANAAEVLEMILDGHVSHVAMEWQSPLRHARARNVNGLAVLGQAQGYLLAAVEREFRHIEVDLVSERDWTRVDGWNASKARRAERVKLLVPAYGDAISRDPDLDKGLDIADSIGLGLWRLGLR
jgi:Holliday junction resolvasome RuvABC endonuclease subunit